LFSATATFAAESMTVALCNVGHIPDTVLERARNETTYVFANMDVQVHWTDCGAEVGARDVRARPDFIVRVQMGGHLTKAGPVSLDSMGRAFMDGTGYGYMVDAYFSAIRDLAFRFSTAGSDQLLGYAIAHELGHLLLGAGHPPNGIMRAYWSEGEVQSINQQHLKFDSAERAAIVHNLQMRKAIRSQP